MAKFYVQLEDKLLKISNEITMESIANALGYTPSDFSGKFEDLINNPLVSDGSGELQITDEVGNIIAKVDTEGIHSIDFIGGIHKLSEKANKSDLPTKLTDLENDLILEDYATKEDVDNIDFNNIKNNPLLENENGELNITDENGNIGLKLNSEGLYVKDVYADEHKLSNKADKEWVTEFVTETVTEGKVNLDGYATEQWVEDKNYLTEHQSLEGYATESWVESKNYLTEHQDISHLATKEEVADVDFFDIKNNPIINAEEGNLIFVDESGNIGLKLDSDNNLTVKDVIAGDNILSNKVDKENGKGLSTEDFTTALKNKLQSLTNYDDTSITEAVNSLRADFDTLISGDTSIAIKTFNEIIAFLEGVEDTESLSGIIASIEQQIANIEIPSLDGYATEDYVNQKEQAIQTWVNNKEFATQEDVANIDFYEIKDNPIVNDGDGKLIFADENGNIGLQLEADNTLYVKDVIAGDNILSNKADKSDLEGLATESYVITKVAEAKLEGSDIVIPVQDVKVNGQTVIKNMIADIDLTPYAKSEDVPSIEGLATEQWVTDKNYLTQHQDISHLASTEYVDGQIANVDVTEQLKDYALKSELPVNVSELNNDKGYLTEHQDISHLATKEELPSLEGLATEEYVNSKDTAVQQWVNEQGYTTQEDIANIDFYSIKDNPIINDGDGRLVFADENGNIGLQIEADNTIFVKDVIAGDHALTNKANISDIPSLEGYATQSFVTSRGYLTEHQDISHLAEKSEIPSLDGYAKTEDIPSLDGYVQSSELPNFDEFAKTEDIPSVDGFVKSEDLPNFDEFAKTEDIPSLEGYAKEEDIPSLYGYATQQWVNEQEFAHQGDLLNMSFNDIQDSPITENNDGEVNIVDDNGNIALKVNDEGIYVKDVIAGDHILSQKVGPNSLKTINGESIIGDGDITIGGSDVYVTDFCIDDFHKIISEIEESIHIDAEGIINAVNENKIISIPINRENSRGGYIANVEDYEDYINFYVNYDVYSISFWIDKIEVTNELNGENVTFTELQSYLVSGESIKTINGEEILGSGDFELATKEEMNVKADDSSVVHKEGDEEIRGTKTFRNSVKFLQSGDNTIVLGADTRMSISDTNNTVLGLTRGSFTVGSQSYPLYMFGQEERPKYNNDEMAMLSDVDAKQDSLVSGTNIKTINGQSILGSGDIVISGGNSDANVAAVDTGDVIDDVTVDYATKTYVDDKVANIDLANYATTAYVDGLVGDINSILESIING